MELSSLDYMDNNIEVVRVDSDTFEFPSRDSEVHHSNDHLPVSNRLRQIRGYNYQIPSRFGILDSGHKYITSTYGISLLVTIIMDFAVVICIFSHKTFWETTDGLYLTYLSIISCFCGVNSFIQHFCDLKKHIAFSFLANFPWVLLDVIFYGVSAMLHFVAVVFSSLYEESHPAIHTEGFSHWIRNFEIVCTAAYGVLFVVSSAFLNSSSFNVVKFSGEIVVQKKVDRGRKRVIVFTETGRPLDGRFPAQQQSMQIFRDPST